MYIPTTVLAQGGAGTIAASTRTVKTDGNFSTNSTSFVDVTGATASISVNSNSRLLITVTGSGSNDTGDAYLCVDVVVDGVNQGGTFGLSLMRAQNGTSGPDMPIGICFLSATLSSGSHTVKIQIRATSGNAAVYASATAPLILSLLEIPT